MLSPHDQCCRLPYSAFETFHFDFISPSRCQLHVLIFARVVVSGVCCLSQSVSNLQWLFVATEALSFFLSVLSFRPVLGGSIQDHLDVLLWLYACLSVSSCVCVCAWLCVWLSSRVQPARHCWDFRRKLCRLATTPIFSLPLHTTSCRAFFFLDVCVCICGCAYVLSHTPKDWAFKHLATLNVSSFACFSAMVHSRH